MSVACDFRDLSLLSRFIPNRVEGNLTHFCFLHSHRLPDLPFREYAFDINESGRSPAASPATHRAKALCGFRWNICEFGHDHTTVTLTSFRCISLSAPHTDRVSRGFGYLRSAAVSNGLWGAGWKAWSYGAGSPKKRSSARD
jgi:hypothetical protein